MRISPESLAVEALQKEGHDVAWGYLTEAQGSTDEEKGFPFVTGLLRGIPMSAAESFMNRSSPWNFGEMVQERILRDA